MDTDCDMRLTSLGPVREVLTRAEKTSEGWSLWVRHRHHAGTLSDCPAQEYDALSDGELVEVLEAVVWGLLARPSFLEHHD